MKESIFSKTLNYGSSSSTGSDAFLAKLNNRGDTLWATYYGGEQNDDGKDVVLDDFGYIYICGTSESQNCVTDVNGDCISTKSNIIASKEAFKLEPDANDAYVAKFDTKGKRVWSSFFGGNGNDYGLGLSHGRYGDVYLTGSTVSTKGLVKNYYQMKNGGGSYDAYFADLYYCKKFAVLKKDTVCYGDTFSINFVDSANYFKYKDSSALKRWNVKFNVHKFTWYGPKDANKIVWDKQQNRNCLFLNNKYSIHPPQMFLHNTLNNIFYHFY